MTIPLPDARELSDEVGKSGGDTKKKKHTKDDEDDDKSDKEEKDEKDDD